ncbi:MAG: hypothetical protein CLLPBCKN_007077 [Chroococcidiopsis cubana SAG 39.79]|uniref:DUF4278 domain-containing protein n=1 Tax=Chroococcidiopsis cubana SAG 39.79 TaxID=388085 RepID=A0AB37UBG9_9CYAN|nr:DUF4278 domain-containing protein [Chroococcidiopsis cubana]MDZ4877642.1 hypothetical protein [Chroococcidiopsis cubana SAG 39.79]PSB54625.1 hypothetical protein C7B79_34590 [Chroococcidiopsis cubana CCALA 043]RUT04540.1 hypothetical protein DSM107010_57200 [Chroococcidiopsis cubana SAG 39.79]
MNLIYRAMIYERNPDKLPDRPFQQVREAGAAYNLSYRGVTYRVDPNIKQSEVFVKPAAYELIYRGMTYSVNRNEQGKVIAITSSANCSLKWLITLRKLVLS